jgi:hypothetical protein
MLIRSSTFDMLCSFDSVASTSTDRTLPQNSSQTLVPSPAEAISDYVNRDVESVLTLGSTRTTGFAGIQKALPVHGPVIDSATPLRASSARNLTSSSVAWSPLVPFPRVRHCETIAASFR